MPSKIGLPDALIALWLPLLNSLIQNHPHLPSVLVSHIVSLLRSPNDETQDKEKQHNSSFDLCMASWAVFIVDRWSTDTWQHNAAVDEELDTLKREDVVVSIMSSLSPNAESTEKTKVYVFF